VKRLENTLVGSTLTIIGHYYLEKRFGKEGLLIVTKKYFYIMMEWIVIDVNTIPIQGHININYLGVNNIFISRGWYNIMQKHGKYDYISN
jgi:hypothetical protein